MLRSFQIAHLAARPERRNNHSQHFIRWGRVDVSNPAMLSAQKSGEGPILVAGSSDIHSRAGSEKRPRLRLDTDLPDPTAARLGQRVTLIGPEIGIDEFAAAAKSTGREVLSHHGSRFHRIYCAI